MLYVGSVTGQPRAISHSLAGSVRSSSTVSSSRSQDRSRLIQEEPGRQQVSSHHRPVTVTVSVSAIVTVSVPVSVSAIVAVTVPVASRAVPITSRFLQKALQSSEPPAGQRPGHRSCRSTLLPGNAGWSDTSPIPPYHHCHHGRPTLYCAR